MQNLEGGLEVSSNAITPKDTRTTETPSTSTKRDTVSPVKDERESEGMMDENLVEEDDDELPF